MLRSMALPDHLSGKRDNLAIARDRFHFDFYHDNIHQMFVSLNLERYRKNKDGFTDSKNNICARIS